MELLRRFPDDATAERWFEETRWPNERFCPKCGYVNTVSIASRRPMPFRCRDCREHFSVLKGTLMQSSKLGLRKWAIALYIMTTGIKGTSSMKLYREVGFRQTTAWFLMQRIREGFIEGTICLSPARWKPTKRQSVTSARTCRMRSARSCASPVPDSAGKAIVAGVKDRESKQVSAAVVERTDAKTLQRFILDRTESAAMVYTDESRAYTGLPRAHKAINHSGREYVRGEETVNGMEGFWSLFKRGYHGTFHHLSEKHLDRNVREFTGRNNIRDLDTLEHMAFLTHAIVGNRLLYADLVA